MCVCVCVCVCREIDDRERMRESGREKVILALFPEPSCFSSLYL